MQHPPDILEHCRGPKQIEKGFPPAGIISGLIFPSQKRSQKKGVK
jgi:hypothetical protein